MCLKAKILPLVGAFQKWKSPRNSGLPKLLLPKYKRPDRPNSSKTREVRQLLYIAPSSQRRRHEEKKKELINMSIEHYRTAHGLASLTWISAYFSPASSRCFKVCRTCWAHIWHICTRACFFIGNLCWWRRSSARGAKTCDGLLTRSFSVLMPMLLDVTCWNHLKPTQNLIYSSLHPTLRPSSKMNCHRAAACL